MTITEHVAVWLREHPHFRRALIVTNTVYALALWALACAPHAAAETGAAALGWTGLKDTYNVPLHDYFVSMVDTSEAVTNNGQHVSAIDPSTWLPWLAHATEAGLTHALTALLLTGEGSALVWMFALMFWFLRFANSGAWLGALAHIGRPIWAAVNTLVEQMWLGPLAIALCTCVAGFHYLNGRIGRAYSVAGNAAILTALWWTVFRDPIDDLTSEHGLLGSARWTGFHIARSINPNNFAPGRSLDSLDDQLNGLISQLISSTVRPMLQLMNFGTVIDTNPVCAHAWSTAVMNANGQGEGPAHAMATTPGCGAVQALAHAQHVGANDIALGAVFLVIGFIVGLFIWYAGITAMVLGAKATYYGVVVVPAFLAGMTGSQRAKNYAHHAGAQLPLHAVQMVIFTTLICISSLGMSWAMTTPLLGHGENTAVPRLLLVAVGALVSILVFHYIDKHFYTDSLGTIGHHVTGAYQSVRRGARADYDDLNDRIDTARQARDRFRDWRQRHSGLDDGDGDDPEITAPGLDVVKPRPSRAPSSPVAADSTTSTAASAARAETGAAPAETAATAGAEAAATVAAPEVTIPAAATVAAAHHLRNRHRNDAPAATAHQPDPVASPPPETGWTLGQPPSDTRTGDDDSVGLAPMAPRHTRGRPDSAPIAADNAWPSADPTPHDERTDPSPRARQDDLDPPLEFPSTPPRPGVKG